MTFEYYEICIVYIHNKGGRVFFFFFKQVNIILCFVCILQKLFHYMNNGLLYEILIIIIM
jgi:hypothetical protein